ncbi:tetratricopeptide repeat protein, partial [Marinilabilia sp.]
VYFSLANYYMQEGDSAHFKEQLFKGFGSKNINFENKFRRFMPFVAQKDNADNPLNGGDIERVFQILIDTHPYEARTYGAYANYLVAGDKKDEAKDLFEEALDIDASQPEIWQEYLFLISSIQENELLFEKSSEAVKFFPEISIFRLFHGVSLFQKDKLEAASKTMETGLQNVEENPGLKGRFHAYLGDIYHSLGDIDKCFSHYEKALEIDENDVIVLNNYSYYLALRGEELDKAEEMSARTVELEPGNPTYLDTYAWVLFKKGRYNEAKFIIERAVDNLEEPSGVVIEHYGDILFKNGDVEGALEKWKKAREIGDHSDFIEEKIEKKKFIDGED